MVIWTAVMGKDGADEGDTEDNPTTRLEYELHRWQRDGLPPFVHTFARERHFNDLEDSPIQESYTYSDGFGRVVMQKVQAEPGLAPYWIDGELQLNPDGSVAQQHTDSRWVGTGRTVYNNKGNPVKQYEPFFSSTPDYEDEADLVEWGVTPVMHYDPLSRVIQTDSPNGTLSRVVFDAWRQENWDPNDTVLESAWYAERQTPGTPADEARAATLAAAHADTPSITHLDTLGRAFLVQADNGTASAHDFYDTASELDIEGNVLGIIDALGTRTIDQAFDVMGRRYRVTSPDAGTRIAITDVANKPLRGWDSRGQTMRGE